MRIPLPPTLVRGILPILRYAVHFTEYEGTLVAPGYGMGSLPLRGNENERGTLHESGKRTQKQPPILVTF
jgi:hypothetical protein